MRKHVGPQKWRVVRAGLEKRRVGVELVSVEAVLFLRSSTDNPRDGNQQIVPIEDPAGRVSGDPENVFDPFPRRGGDEIEGRRP